MVYTVTSVFKSCPHLGRLGSTQKRILPASDPGQYELLNSVGGSFMLAHAMCAMVECTHTHNGTIP